MKICILGHYPSDNERYSGVSRVVYNLAHEMSKISDDVVVLKKKRYAKFFKKEKCGKEKNLTICNVSHIGLIYKLIREKYDIINIHNMSSFFVLPLILKRFKLIESKIIFVSHGIVDLEKKEKRYDYPLRYELYQRISIYWSDHIIAVSSYLKKHIQECYTINGNKISVIGNAVDYHFFQEARSSTSLYLPKKYALFVGEITKIKGLDFLLEAIKKVDITLVLIGKKTPYYDELKKNYSNYFELGQVLHYEGLDENDLLFTYSNSLFCVLPSRHEPYGLVVLEAMAVGKPVIITDQVGAKEVIENGQEGFIVPFGDSDILADIMRNLIENENIIEKMGMLAKKKALENTWEIKAREYYNLYNNIIKKYG